MLTISQFQICMGLQVLRERRHFTAQDLSIQAGLPSGEVSRIEAGEVGLDYLTAARLTQVLGVNLADIAVAAYRLDSAMVEDRYREMAARMRATGNTGLSIWHLPD
ncbi:helix-turn-helix domain-containing protein [Massilia jejuensis]|uniref:Helix-turn-helix domain-containing protein n=1 Tax=Massilia jejuensis TaxID=648894 RepID=A0ABW0PJK7_9BURK